MPAKTLSFRIGDVFKPDDDLSVWFCTIALAHNDLVTTHVRVNEATAEWESFYYWRMAIGHYSEIMLFLRHMREKPAIKAFITSSPPKLQKAYQTALDLYDQHSRVAKHVRNKTAFHYPDPKGIRAMRRALRDEDIQDDCGGVTSTSGKVGDARMHYADEVLAKMFMNEAGKIANTIDEVYAVLGESVAAFMRFANQAQDEFFSRQPERTVEFRVEKA
jgi:hypothetical protein